jgi:hypothetical protein
MAPEDEGASGGEAPVDAGGETPAAETDTAPADQAAPTYDWMPEQFRGDDGPDFDGFRQHYTDLAAEAAIRNEALASVPEAPDGYDLALPEDLDFGDLDLPENFAVELKTDDEAMATLFDELRGFLHESQLPKEAGQKVMGMLAKYEARQYAKAASEVDAQIKQLGPQAGERLSRVTRSLETKLSAPQATALKSALRSADAVRALETLLAPRSLGANNAPKPRPPADDLEAYYSTPTS